MAKPFREEIDSLEQSVARLLPEMSSEQRLELGAFVSQSIATIGISSQVKRDLGDDEIARVVVLVGVMNVFGAYVPKYVDSHQLKCADLLAAYAYYCLRVAGFALRRMGRSEDAGVEVGIRLARRALALAFALGDRNPYLQEVQDAQTRGAREVRNAQLERYRDWVKHAYLQEWKDSRLSRKAIATRLRKALGRHISKLTVEAKHSKMPPPLGCPQESTVYTWLRKDFPKKKK